MLSVPAMHIIYNVLSSIACIHPVSSEPSVFHDAFVVCMGYYR